ncbi:MAG: MFS transporter [Pseudomonadota bacterium]|nr:MFS transporter [Pseudomonadota bacterium]
MKDSPPHPISGSAATSLLFANIAHFYSHMMMLVYPTVVIALEAAFNRPFGELLSLSFVGFVLYGVAALPAGWLGDKWSSPGMLAVFFIGTGASGIAAGFVSGPLGIAVALGVIGLFSSIYHPVGTAWVVANAKARGKALGVNGVFGTAGIAATPLLAGLLTAGFGWRYAFIVPGSVILLTGFLFLFFMRNMSGGQSEKQPSVDAAIPRARAILGLSILAVTALCVGLLAQATTVGMPKIFAVGAPDISEWAGLIGAGGLASLALAIGAIGQLAGGWLADRYRLTLVYPMIYVVMIPVALLAGSLSGLPLVGAAGAVMFLIKASLPTENSLVAQYCPADWRASAYGAKFVLGLGISSVAIPLTGAIYDSTGGFWWVFIGMGILAGVIICFATFLPGVGERGASTKRVEEPLSGPAA